MGRFCFYVKLKANLSIEDPSILDVDPHGSPCQRETLGCTRL